MKTITKVALSNDKNNRTRSILVMLAIFLSTMLLTVICVFANGIIKGNKANAGANSGTFYGVFKSLSKETIQELERRSETARLGLMAQAGMIESDINVSLAFVDDDVRQMMNMDSRLAEGSFPENENEIAAQPSFFSGIGYENIKVGDTVVLPYRADLTQTYENTEFVVSGLIKEQEEGQLQRSYLALCSEEFYESRYDEAGRRYNVYFRLNDSVQMTTDNYEEVILEIAQKCGIEETQVNVNKAYLYWLLDPGMETIVACIVIALCVILFSVIVIYNIFQVGIAQKVQEYGKIRALGATHRQMRKLIYREGMLLAAISIPAGLIFGYLLAWVSFDWMMVQSSSSTGMGIETVSLFSLPMLLLSAGLAFLTVFMALRKPMKIVADISPVEAIRYQESTKRRKAGKRKGKKEVSVASLALANISGNRKQTISTILTMGLSCVLFVILANCVGNIDEEFDARMYVEHGQFEIKLDYALNDEAYPENNLDFILKDNPLNQQLLEEIRQLEGVTEVKTRLVLAAAKDGKPTGVSVLSREDFENEIRATSIGNMDYQQAVENGSIFYGWANFIEEGGINLDDQLSMKMADGTGEYDYQGKMAGSFGGIDTSWAIPEETYEKMGLSGESIGYIWVDCKEKDVEKVQQGLEELLKGKEQIEFSTFHSALDSSKLLTKVMKAGCYLFMGIVGLIGFMNMANTMIISIITKKQEYGILQAVGMTNAQFNRSLQLQGLIFTVGTVVVALAVGLPVGYAAFVYARNSGFVGMNVYSAPVTEILVMVVLIAILQIVLSFVLSRNIKRETLVERIRYQG